VNNNDDVILEHVIKLFGIILSPQRQMIESIHGKLPVKACDEFSLGYMVGLCDGAGKVFQICDPRLQITLMTLALNFSLGDEEVGIREKAFLEDIKAMSYTKPIEYLKGKGEGEIDFINTIKTHRPHFGWHLYVEGII